LGGKAADLDVSAGADSVKSLILNAKRSDSGKFVNIHVSGWEEVQGPDKYDGKDIPW